MQTTKQMVRSGRGTHITRATCIPGRRTHITGNVFPRLGNTYHQGYVFPTLNRFDNPAARQGVIETVAVVYELAKRTQEKVFADWAQ